MVTVAAAMNPDLCQNCHREVHLGPDGARLLMEPTALAGGPSMIKTCALSDICPNVRPELLRGSCPDLR